MEKVVFFLKKKDKLLYNHIVYNRPIFPAVGSLEIVLQSAHKQNPDTAKRKPYQLNNVLWVSPIEVEHDEKGLEVIFNEKMDGYQYSIKDKKEDGKKIYVTGTLLYRYQNTDNEQSQLDLETLRQRLPKQCDKSAIYNSFESIGIRYKDLFMSLDEISFNKEEILGKSYYKGNNKDYYLNPAIMDSAIQCALLCVKKNLNNNFAYVPFLAKQVNILGDLPCQCYVYSKCIDRNKEEGFARFNIFIANEQGKVLVHITDLCVKQFPLPSINDEKILSPK